MGLLIVSLILVVLALQVANLASRRGARMSEKSQVELEYEEIFNLPTHLICVIDPDGIFRKTNRAQKHILGWEPEELVGRSVAGFVHSEDIALTQQAIGQLFQGVPIITDFRNRCLHQDGGYRWISWSGTARKGQIYCIGSDVTRQIEAEQSLERERLKLQASEAKFRRLYDANMVGILLWDHSGSITDANDCFLQMIGYTREDLHAGRVSWADMTPPEYRHLDEIALRQIQETGVGPVFEKEYIRKDGSRIPVMLAGAGFHAAADAGIALVLDMSEQKRIQTELRKAVRMRDEFLSVASHELKTPLTSLTLQTQMRRRQLETGNSEAFAPARLQRMLDTDLKQLARLNRLIDDMLDISRISMGKFQVQLEPTDLSTLISEVAEQFRPQLENAGYALHLDIPPGISAKLDSYRMEQALINLLTNALRYGDRKPIRVSVSETETMIRIAVQDQGRGIAREDWDRIFQPFERAVPNKEISGMGLGLSISREIIERHGGALRVESEPGKGATFRVELPRS